MINQTLHRLFSGVLIFALSLAIIPAESFHHHESETVVCLDQEAHIEAPHFDCELFDFVLPLMFKASAEIFKNFQHFIQRFEIFSFQSFTSLKSELPQGRAPPFLSFGF